MSDEKRVLGRLFLICDSSTDINTNLEIIPKIISHLDADLTEKYKTEKHKYSLLLQSHRRLWENAQDWYSQDRRNAGHADKRLQKIFGELLKISREENLHILDITDMPLGVKPEDEERKA